MHIKTITIHEATIILSVIVEHALYTPTKGKLNSRAQKEEDMISKQQQAEFLIEAMPYVRKYQNKILVIKYGGNAMQSEELKNSVMRDLTMLRMVGINVVLVHGGGPEINALLKKVNKESKFIDGLRYTDEETVEYVAMALAGKESAFESEVWKEITNDGLASVSTVSIVPASQ